MAGLVKEFTNYTLTQQELLSGFPLFYIPVDEMGCVVGAPQAKFLKAYLFNWVLNKGQIIPCGHDDWDDFALCLYEGRMGHAKYAMNATANEVQDRGYGNFQRYEPGDLIWENQ